MTNEDWKGDLPSDWREVLSGEFMKDYWPRLIQYVEDERAQHAVYPPRESVFEAFRLSPFAKTRVVILGQDPYPQPGLAHGLCFSVPSTEPIPLSLNNIFKVMKAEEIPRPEHGDLSAWGRQGVLLLNTTMTVRGGVAGSHRASGWQKFTNAVIDVLNKKQEPVVFVLWGRHAQRKRKRIHPPHHVLEAPHPAARGNARHELLRSKPFSEVNAHLVEPIAWGA